MKNTIESLFDNLWEQYTIRNNSVKKVYDLLKSEGENIINDHVAFRTFNHPKVNIDKLAKVFIDLGYIAKQEYTFEQKKLRAVHFEQPNDKTAPLVFISELKLEEFSDDFNSTINKIINQIPEEKIISEDFVYSGRHWENISHETYEKLRSESEYAAWLYVEGFKANHFTVLVNELKKYNDLIKLNNLLKENGFIMNNPKNEVQGSAEQFLEQSSIKASIINEHFVEGEIPVTGCYYEFAKRYKMPDGNLFRGFIADSADKIFESTDYYKK